MLGGYEMIEIAPLLLMGEGERERELREGGGGGRLELGIVDSL